MYPLPVNFTSPMDAFLYPNLVTGGWFWSLILFAIYIVSYIALSYATSTMKAFSAVGLFGAFLSTFMYAAGMIQQPVWIISVVIAFASFLMLLFNHGQYE